METKEFNQIINHLGFTTRRAAQVFGIHEQHLGRVRGGKTKVSPRLANQARAVLEIVRLRLQVSYLTAELQRLHQQHQRNTDHDDQNTTDRT